jgi:hypothetical protein
MKKKVKNERVFKCWMCNDKKERAYFNTRTRVGWCHNCSSIITESNYKNKTGVSFNVSNYYNDEKSPKMLERDYQPREIPIDKDYLSSYLMTRGFYTGYRLSHIYPGLEDNTIGTLLDGTTPTFKTFASIQYRNRVKFNCNTGFHDKKFWIARSMDGAEKKVLFPSKELSGGVGKSDAIFINPYYLNEREIINEFYQCIPVVVEGDFDAMSIFQTFKNKIYVGVAIMGKNMSTTQLQLIKNIFGIDEVVICLDGALKSDNHVEIESLSKCKEDLRERFEMHMELVKTWELGPFDPNELFIINKKWVTQLLENGSYKDFISS